MKRVLFITFCCLFVVSVYSQDKSKKKESFTSSSAKNNEKADLQKRNVDNNNSNQQIEIIKMQEVPTREELPSRAEIPIRGSGQVENHPIAVNRYGKQKIEAMSLNKRKEIEYLYYKSYRIEQGTICEKLKDEEFDIMSYDHLRDQLEWIEISLNDGCNQVLILEPKSIMEEKIKKLIK